ncbi:HutD/Ves family protein [Marinomonas posidonica]|uniref:HutD-family protein n=1 Tax=Marinomonas posidonica (strain CECT 7376 / NCIMB 14433 / IVIA-Po-181) TaxID=491952 RepID=F6CYE5_MARPP|nr:HutD family protein [Marinomonas posidonica]AEF53472.1 HutD-family protein [Marinomonas posidonica IVIA-Po-181]
MLNDTSIFSIIEQADYPIVPWKNGLGHTRNIARLSDEQGLQYRISQASVVENGLFSDFSGLHRILILLSGHGLAMTHQNEQGMQHIRLTKVLEMAQFSGGDQTFASLTDGPIEDLNVMVREADTKAQVIARQAPTELAFDPIQSNALLHAIYCAEECELYDHHADRFHSFSAHSFITLLNSEMDPNSLRKRPLDLIRGRVIQIQIMKTPSS